MWTLGYRRHSVAMGLSSGEVLEEFEIDHRIEGFQEFFSRIEKHRETKNCALAVAMEGYNGYARPLDSLVRQRGYRLYNLNNLKFARFKEIFPGAAKSDQIDARKGLELFQLSDHLPLAKEVLQEVTGTPPGNEVLKRLTRRRRRLVNERVRVVNKPPGRSASGVSGTLRDHRRSEQPVVFKFPSQCGHVAPARPAQAQHTAQDPVGGSEVCCHNRGLAEACPF
ncbi:MAG: IS110 family transposase [Candidatus Binatia bacterium]